LVPHIEGAAELLRDGAVPVKHDEMILRTPQAWPQFHVMNWASEFVQEKR
jgi:hypothetical protein